VHRNWVRAQKPLATSCTFAADVHTEVSADMRRILMDWLWGLCRVQWKCSVGPDTMLLTVQLIDRRLACTTAPPVKRKRLQAVGAACMLLASKMENIWPVDAYYLAQQSDGGFSRVKLLAVERRVCVVLQHEFALPTAWHFASYYTEHIAPRCRRLQSSTLAALHAMTMQSSWVSAQPQLAAVGCVMWAMHNLHLVELAPVSEAACAPSDWDVSVRTGEPACGPECRCLLDAPNRKTPTQQQEKPTTHHVNICSQDEAARTRISAHLSKLADVSGVPAAERTAALRQALTAFCVACERPACKVDNKRFRRHWLLATSANCERVKHAVDACRRQLAALDAE
jgi:hypothetical protein